MRHGDKGDKVKAVQARLDALGYTLPMYGADGHLGDETWDALQDFGRDAVTGLVVDERILAELFEPTRKAPPMGAVFEAQLAAGVALYDVAGLLPVHRTKRYRTRAVEDIWRCYIHHSGAAGPDGAPDATDGFGGMLGSARYVVEDDDHHWPGFAYTYWLSADPDVDDVGNLCAYRGSPDELRTYHTGGDANTHGIAVCFQGDRTRTPPTAEQLAMADALLPWLVDRHELALDDDTEGLSTHSRSRRFGGTGKPSCPGPYLEAYVEALRELA